MSRFAPTSLRSIYAPRRLRLESLEDRCMMAHPAVSAVNVAGTSWSSSFVSYLESSGLGTGGYAIPVGSSTQLQTLSWNNVNQIKITFSEDVNVDAADLSVSGVNTVARTFNAFSYNATTHTATWTLSMPITKDKLMLDLDADGMDPVTSVSTGEALDGVWTNCQSTYSSGNGVGGTDFEFRLNALPGDADGSTFVNTCDANVVYQRLNKSTTDASYLARCDIDGSGTISVTDYSLALARIGNTLPTGDPIGMTNDAPTTSGISDLGIAAGTVDHVLSLPDFFSDAETASSALAYALISNSNSSLVSSTSIDSSGHLTLGFATGVTGSASITLQATDAAGLIVQTTFVVNVSAAPYVEDFRCVHEGGNTWTFSGSVTDTDDDVEGYVVTLGGVLASYNYTVVVQADGTFALTVEVAGLQSGNATAQTVDSHGVQSNVATDWIDV